MRSSMPAQSQELGPACPGIDFHKGVIAVSLAGQQGFQLGPRRAIFQAFQLLPRLFEAGFIALLVGEFRIADGVTQIPFQGLDSLHRGRKP